jgi:hypothetical protein
MNRNLFQCAREFSRKYFEALQNPRSEIVAATTSSVKRALKRCRSKRAKFLQRKEKKSLRSMMRERNENYPVAAS